MMGSRSMERITTFAFDRMVLQPIALADRLFGERAWEALDHLTSILSFQTGRFMRNRLPKDGPHKLSAVMELVDRCEGWAGVRGTWEVQDENTVLRKVAECPFQTTLSGTPAFCTRLGTIMGRASLAGAFPEQKFEYEILSTLSQGHDCCIYRIHLKDK